MASINKCRNAVIPLVALVFFFIMASLAFAETKVFVEEYTYQASEADSKLSSRTIALEQVKRLLLEKLGTYLESETEVKNFQLTKDQIVVLTAGIVRAEIIEERWDGKTYFLKAKMEADPENVTNSINKLRQDRQKTKELEETRKKADEALREVERLRKELEIAKTGKTEQDQYTRAVNRLSATDWFEKGYGLQIADKHQEATGAYTKAIELNPNFVEAYNNRGAAYGDLRDYRQAIENYDKAIELNPNCVEAYNNRGFAYDNLGDQRQAIRDFNKAIELDPKNAGAYSNRGLAYGHRGDYRQAIENYDKAIELDPKNAGNYNNRGLAYGHLGDHRQAIRDFDRAIVLDPKYAMGYYNRGEPYFRLGDYRQAIENYDKAIELNPNYAEAYCNRGLAYGRLGDVRQAIEDFKIAARLGSKKAQNILRSQGISW